MDIDLSSGEVDIIFEHLDSDGDGAIAIDEFVLQFGHGRPTQGEGEEERPLSEGKYAPHTATI